MSEPNNQNNPEKPKWWSKLKRGVKKGFKIVLPIAASWAAGVIFPPAGAALYKFLKDKMDQSSIKISDETLHKLCEDAIGKEIPDLVLEKLQESLREEIGKSTKINKEHLEMVLGTFLRPLNDSINDAMKYIKEFPDQIEYLMGEWKAENAQLIKELQTDMSKNFDEVKSSIANQSEKIDVILTKLENFENILNEDFWKGAKQIFSSKKIKALDLKLVSQAQISMANFSSRYDINFNPEYFTFRKEATDAFKDFLHSLSTQAYSKRNCFLVLAGAGMGKTWLLASWIHKISGEQLDMQETQKFIPFFISLGSRLGFEDEFCKLFGANSRFDVLDRLEKVKIQSKLTPILFFDGLDEVREEASKVLRTIINLSKAKIPVILSCRDIDWVEEPEIFEMHSKLKIYFFDHDAGSSYEYKEASCMPSLSFNTFSRSEFSDAVKRYQIPKEAFYNDNLKKIGYHPILLRLLSNYYKTNNRLPDPTNPDDFEDIFLGKENAKPETYVLGRLGVIRKRKDYLVSLTRKFLDTGKNELNYEDLKDLINQKEEYKVIRSAGLIKERISRYSTTFYLNEIYRPHLEHMAELAGGVIEKPEISKPIESIPLEKENSADRKKYNYFAKMGNDYLESKEYQEALDNFQQAREVCKELYDPKLTNEADSLIKKTENLIKKTQEAMEKTRREDQLRQNISFRSAQIPQFEADILQEIEKLAKKDFTKVNKVEGETGMSFSVENQRVTEIGLNNCRSSTIPESITKLESLQLLSLSGNGLTTLPESITKLISLQKLFLSGNKLTTLPDSIGNLTSLQTLDLNMNELSTLPDSIGNLTSLQTLYLGGDYYLHNNLERLPESIGNLTSLTYLSLDFNKFTTLPESITKITSLEILDLGSNKLSTLPESIGNLKSLILLNLGDNQLTTLPESITRLESLNSLNVRSNKLKTLPESIANMTSLKNLGISNNTLDSKAKSVVKQLKKNGVNVSPLIFQLK